MIIESGGRLGAQWAANLAQKGRNLQDSAAVFQATFREVHAICRRLLGLTISRGDAHLWRMMQFTIAHQRTSEYPFVFKYAFCRTERDAPKIATLAAAVHLLQSSAFITDDIFDAAEQRYGHSAIHRRYGISNAVIATELMQSIALETIAAELDKGNFQNRCRVMKIFNQIVRELYVGQYLDVYHTGDTGMSSREYYRVIALGVGNYFANVAQCGALLAGKSEAEVASLTQYGYHYGMALFITDDIVDIVQTPQQTGKTYASDLRNRRMRLPMICALRKTAGKDRAFLRNFLHGGEPSSAAIQKAAGVIANCGALDDCLLVVNRHLAASLRTLESVPNVLTRARLGWLSETLLEAQRLKAGISPE